MLVRGLSGGHLPQDGEGRGIRKETEKNETALLGGLYGGYIGYDKLINNTNNTKCDTKKVKKLLI